MPPLDNLEFLRQLRDFAQCEADLAGRRFFAAHASFLALDEVLRSAEAKQEAERYLSRRRPPRSTHVVRRAIA